MNIEQIEVASDLYEAGPSFEGPGPYIAECYFVVVTFNNGERWVHDARFYGAEKMTGEEYDGEPFYADVRPQAEAKAQALCDRIRNAVIKGRFLDKAHWSDYYPVYGSAAYCN